jgi:hypothetical protein
VLVLLLVVVTAGFILIGLELSVQRRTSERTLSHLKDFDGGVAVSFDRIDAALARIERMTGVLVIPRCGAGDCNRPAVFRIRPMDRDEDLFTCATHDVWEGDRSVLRTPVPDSTRVGSP